MSDKIFFIDEYFKRLEKDLNKAAELLSDPKYYLEGILVLSCFLVHLPHPAIRICVMEKPT